MKKFNNSEVRIVVIENEPYFVAVDVCRVLGMSNTAESLRSLDDDDIISTDTVDRLGRKQNVNAVNESGLYDLVLRSRKPQARLFRKWVTSEVLPSIRKTGRYTISESLKSKSTKAQNLLTDEWRKSGVKLPKEFACLTVEEYKALQFEKGKRKKDFTEGELKTLMALEAMEMLNLHYNPVEGFIECRESINTTAEKVNEIKYKNRKLIQK